ncbi:MAG TPA: rhodanese-like domain-containing protein [Xanthobacteraceae bacterium]|nr:rhodanese-like domain-containing protein [Xanthobacteraceae bacterium]
MRLISPDTLRARLRGKREHAILDVRREGDYAKGHLFFASNVPRSILELRIEQLVPRVDTPITIAAKGLHADDVGDVLARYGYTNVCALDGENDGWTATGGQLFAGLNVPSKAFGEFVEIEADTPHVSPEELERLLHNGETIMVLDSRPFAEYQVMSIPGAINCPGAELVYRFFENVPSPQTTVVVNCAGRTRSIIGAQSLIDANVPNRVIALRDGTMGWHLAGFKLDHGKDRRAARPGSRGLSEARALASRRAERAGVESLTPEQCNDLLARNDRRTTYLFDVRDPLDYAEGHRCGAVSAPGGQLVQTLDTFAAVHNARFILCDSDGVRAPMTATWLKQMGIRDVFTVCDDVPTSTGVPVAPKAETLLKDAPVVGLNDAEALRLAGCRVLDFGTSKDYRHAHIAGALFTERHDAKDTAGRTGGKLILTSPDGRLARLVAGELHGQGLQAFAIEGGTAAWIAAGLPVESGPGNLPERPTDVFYRPYDLTVAAEDAMREYLDWEKGLLDHIIDEPGVAFAREPSSLSQRRLFSEVYNKAKS